MCIKYWRRWCCPASTEPRPPRTEDVRVRGYVYPIPELAVAEDGQQVYLHLEEGYTKADNVFVEYPQRNPLNKVYHWTQHTIRCGLAIPRCINFRETWVSWHEQPCPFCSGDIDVPYDHRSLLIPLGDGWGTPPVGQPSLFRKIQIHRPTAESSAAEREKWDKYAQSYTIRLLKLLFNAITKSRGFPIPEKQFGGLWFWVWPETWCRNDIDHVSGVLAEDMTCPCDPEQRHYSSITWQKKFNEAIKIRAEVECHRQFTMVTDPITGISQPHSNPIPHPQLVSVLDSQILSDYIEAFMSRQKVLGNEMKFVCGIEQIAHERSRAFAPKIQKCRIQLQEAGEAVVERDVVGPPPGWELPANDWKGVRLWNSRLQLRQDFLQWAIRFVSFDVGLGEEIADYIADGMLALLNPWPNPFFAHDPTRPPLGSFPQDSPGQRTIEQVMYALEAFWPDNWVKDSEFIEGIEKSLGAEWAMSHNRSTHKNDCLRMNKETGTFLKANRLGMEQLAAEAGQDGSPPACPLCGEDYVHNPQLHFATKLPCCGALIGASCAKKVLFKSPLRKQMFDEEGLGVENPDDWAKAWICPFCRGSLEALAPPRQISVPGIPPFCHTVEPGLAERCFF